MDRMALIEAARGDRPLDLAITNVDLVHVFTCGFSRGARHSASGEGAGDIGVGADGDARGAPKRFAGYGGCGDSES